MDKYLEKLGFSKGTTHSNLYLISIENGLLIIVIFVDDIIFGGDDEASDKFVDEMKKDVEMRYFIDLQIALNDEGIFIS